MDLLNLHSMKNRYFGLRHGTSKADAEHVIVSNPRIGTTAYGLTELGHSEVENSVTAAIKAGWLDKHTLIFCSDFKRTMESAHFARGLLQARTPFRYFELRERRFAEFDGSSADNYARVWEHDLVDPNSTEFGCESVNSVLERMQSFVQWIERHDNDRTILMVSHDDPLRILLTAFCDLPPGQHRQIKPFQNGEIRPFAPILKE